MIRRPPRSTRKESSAASDVYKRQDEWYNTPNLHMCTIKDFFHFVKSKDIKIFKSLALNNLNKSTINESNLGVKNLFADLGIFLIEK